MQDKNMTAREVLERSSPEKVKETILATQEATLRRQELSIKILKLAIALALANIAIVGYRLLFE